MNLAIFLDVPQCPCEQQPPATLGQPEAPVDLAAWTAYLQALRNDMVAAWNGARNAYVALERVRERLGLPFLAVPGEADAVGALTAEQNQEFIEAGAAATLLTQWMDEALSGKRKIAYDAGRNDFVIEALDSDVVFIEIRSGKPTLISRTTGQPVPVSGTVGAAPVIAWIVGAGIAIAAVVATWQVSTAYFEKERVLAEEKTKQTLATKQAELVSSGKATPEQAKAMTDAIYIGAKELEEARGAAGEREGGTARKIADTVQTVLWVGLGIAGIYFLAKVIPPALEAA